MDFLRNLPILKVTRIESLDLDFTGSKYHIRSFLNVAKHWINNTGSVTCLSITVEPSELWDYPEYDQFGRTKSLTDTSLHLKAQFRQVEGLKLNTWFWQAEMGKVLTWEGAFP
jgi:hypothetical protein